AGARVGTVDRFQGQEAAVVIVSLTTSSADDIPRGLDFLFSRERLNVAVSRAEALSVMVGSPALLRTRCHTVAQLRLVNGLCRYVELAKTGYGSKQHFA
ncbi:MAG: AAA domain-containing protein, partial [Candidatus Dormibacteraeota bacterium]|nr:AAA domain-containing protein [Candidatus Dormibacteraeota bacterium]